MKKLCRWHIVATGLVVVLAGALGSYFFKQDAPPKYVTTMVVRGDLENTVIAMGTLYAFKQVDVGAQVSGQLKSLKVKLGEKVAKGQWLAEIDPVILQNTLRAAQIKEEDLLAQKRATAAQLKQALFAWQRQKQMLRHAATSRENFEVAQAELAVKRANLASLDAQISGARIQINTAQANLDYTRIIAPMDGEVVAIVTQEGQTVIAQQQAPVILKLADLDTITVKAQVSEADIIRVHPGQTTYFTILGEPDKRYYGKLRAIEPAPQNFLETQNGANGTGASRATSNTAVFYNALFEVPNPAHRLHISMTAEVNIVLDRALNTLYIPAAALDTKDKAGIYTVRVLGVKGKCETRKIQIGMNNNVQVEVTSGLKEGERVVIGETAADGASASSAGL